MAAVSVSQRDRLPCERHTMMGGACAGASYDVRCERQAVDGPAMPVPSRVHTQMRHQIEERVIIHRVIPPVPQWPSRDRTISTDVMATSAARSV